MTTSATTPASCWPPLSGKHCQAGRARESRAEGRGDPFTREVGGGRRKGLGSNSTTSTVALMALLCCSALSYARHARRIQPHLPGPPESLPLILGTFSPKVPDLLLSPGPLLQVCLLPACETHLCGHEGGGEGPKDRCGHPPRASPLPPRVVHHDCHGLGQR